MTASVLNVVTGLGAGGAERMLVQLATAAQGRGMPQHVVTLGDRGLYADALEASGVAVTALGMTSIGTAPRALAQLIGTLNRLSPTVVQGWMYHGNIMAALAHRLAPGQKSRTLLWNLRASNMDDTRYRQILSWSARISSWPDLVVANSESGAAFHSARGYRPRHMIVIANGVATEEFRPNPGHRDTLRRWLGIPADAPVAIHVARVDPMKDHTTFLVAMAKIPHVYALMVGTGTGELVGPPNVRGLGLRSDMARLYSVADIVVSSSAFGEGFSNAIAEGMSAGLVPVGTDVGDTFRIVGDTGHIVAPGDPEALAAAIAAEGARSPEERARRGLAARARILENFAFERAIDSFMGLYDTWRPAAA